ncbi:PREDICTED: protein FAM173A [Gekko japonicus]|uniref:Protein FAM173A n=1 Tax=Gekko japonicus TaxID=146911 RepID=A0ABM1K610_GEKJA|nr:PREDICTED: protein FAM173A [Gekko japonicus]
MDPEDTEQLAAEVRGKTVSGWDLLQIATGTGLAAYVVWAGILMPGFRRVPLKLQVPYVPASAKQLENVMLLLEGRSGKLVDLGSGDGRIVLEAYRQGFRPSVGYELNPWLLRLSSYRAWKAGCYGKVSYRREDLWKVDLSDCANVTVFLAPSVLQLLERKLLTELPEEARVVAGRYPLPNWTPTSTAGDGPNQAWAYDLKAVRRARQDKPERSSV